MQPALLVLDANILIRAIIGKKVLELLLKFKDKVTFLVPDVCMEDARHYLSVIFKKRGLSLEPAQIILEQIEGLIQLVEETIYTKYKDEAKRRIALRDPQDWPVVATALTFNSPIWTEDQDFFGAGIPTWTTDRVHLFFGFL